MVANLSSFSNYNTGAMIYKKMIAYYSSRMYINTCF